MPPLTHALQHRDARVLQHCAINAVEPMDVGIPCVLDGLPVERVTMDPGNNRSTHVIRVPSLLGLGQSRLHLLESEVFDFLEMLPCARNGPHHLLRDTPNVHAGACTAKRQSHD